MWSILTLISFAALFSADGLAIPIGLGIITTLANIVANFVTALNIIIILILALIGVVLIFALVGDKPDVNPVKDFADSLVKEVGVIKTGNTLAFNKKTFIFVTLPFWGILIASGWIFTALVWMSVHAALHAYMRAVRAYFNKTYINEIKEQKDETATASDKLASNDLA